MATKKEIQAVVDLIDDSYEVINKDDYEVYMFHLRNLLAKQQPYVDILQTGRPVTISLTSELTSYREPPSKPFHHVALVLSPEDLHTL